MFAEALDSSEPFGALCKLAEAQVAQGVPQPELLAAFQRQLSSQEGASDERLYNALADVMDFIVGWCSPEASLYRSGTSRGGTT
jgi:hypothetical protein